MEVAYGSDGLGTDEGHVSTEHEHVIVVRKCGGALHKRVSGAKLFELFDELHTERRDCLADAFGLMSDDAEDVSRSNDLAGGAHNVGEQWASCNLVQHLGQL
jgi:hypothetical protein